MKLSKKEFDKVVRRAISRVPEELRQHLDNILISVQKRPTREMMEEVDQSPDEPLLGLFQGFPLSERSSTSPPLFPDSILLFQEPLEETSETLEELEEQIELTVAHEIAHFFGITERDLQNSDMNSRPPCCPLSVQSLPPSLRFLF
jgi:predicted Zn-dependent protease with MMP-like domain